MSWRAAVALLAAALAGCHTAPTSFPPLARAAEPQAVDEPPPAAPKADPKAKPPADQPPADKPGAVPPAPPDPPPPVTGTAASVGGPLTLDEVLVAVERHYPLLRAVEQERAVAGGRLLSSLGAFDLNLVGNADGQGTTYDNFRSGFGVTQGLPVAGLGLFAGYRNGYGEFPTYNLGQKTADGGEFRAGMSLPLLRDRAIDRPRASIRQARLDVAIAEPTIDRQRLDFHRAAARTYWNWVAAGQRLKVVADLVKLATDRDEQIKGRVNAEVAGNFERIDNQQNIALRNGVLVQAERTFQQATIELSLFLRNDTGSPSLAGLDRLPALPEPTPIEPGAFEAALRSALDLRPEPVRLRLLRERTAVDLALATNQTLPSLNATLGVSQDVGPGKSSLSGSNGLERTSLTAGLSYQLPVQRREARGRVAATQAQLVQLEQQLRQAEDVVRAEVQDTFSALERAYEFHRQAKKRVELARQVAEGERRLFRGERSDVLRVTLREQAAFDADIVEITARQDYFRALADFRAAVGMVGVTDRR